MLRSVKYGLSGAILAGVVGGTVAFTSTSDKTVHLLVDGRPQTVHTSASDVSGALRSAHLSAGAHDLLAPSAGSPLKDGETIVLKRGRLLQLSIDGTERSIWTTAPTVAQAMGDLGFTRSDFLSVSRSTRLPLGPTTIDVRTPKAVTVEHDGTTTRLSTTDATVGRLLDSLGLTLGDRDTISVPVTAAVTSGQTIVIKRVVRKIITQQQPIPFGTKSVDNPKALAGDTTIVRAGKAGTKVLRWAVVYVDGTFAGKTQLPAVIAQAPVTQVKSVGTKISNPGSNQAIAQQMMLAEYGWGSDQFSCLVSMWNRESNWSVSAANSSGAYGIPQSLPGSKMASAGADWQTNPATQIKWGLGYVHDRYGTPCGAWGFWQAHNYY